MNAKIKMPTRSTRYRDISSDPAFIQKSSKNRGPSHDTAILQAGRISVLLMKYLCVFCLRHFPVLCSQGKKNQKIFLFS